MVRVAEDGIREEEEERWGEDEEGEAGVGELRLGLEEEGSEAGEEEEGVGGIWRKGRRLEMGMGG